MSEIILQSALPVPSPREAIGIRAATMDDLPFVDGLHKKFSRNLGFATFETLKGKINLGQMIVAEAGGEKVGYLIGQDRYFKREDVGIVYQLAVTPGKQRGFIGAALLKAQFDRSAYGCRLYCCWCAQDLAANQFWESMGFVPLAFRAGSEKKQRVHIFWQKKIRGRDDTCHWWFPSKTDQGALRADRLAFPIPPGVHWRDVQPVKMLGDEPHADEAPNKIARRTTRRPPEQPKPVPQRGPLFGPPGAVESIPIDENPKPVKPVKQKPVKKKIAPQFIAAARELRDRYLEQVNEHGYRLESAGKYELTRKITETALPRLAA